MITFASRSSTFRMTILSFVLAIMGVALAQTPLEPLRSAGERPIDIEHIRLDLIVDLPKKTVEGRATIDFRTFRETRSAALDAVDFEVKKVLLGKDEKNGKSIPFTHDGKKLNIEFDPVLPAEESFSLKIDYRVREPKTGLHFFGPTKAEPNTPLTVWSQGEAITNRYWFPCLDQPNERQTTELVATVPEGFEVLSNGKLLEKKASDDKRYTTFHWKQDKPHVAYLVTMVVGKFDVVQEEWNGLPVTYYVPSGRKDEIGRTFGRTREMLTFFSKRFGINYPWEKYAQVVVEQFTSGGMENTSATTLHDRALHDERAFLDSSPDGLIAHELGHQWWGDLVTCRDWAHLWLNEGFATYSEAIWVEHAQGADEFAYNLIGKSRSAMAGGTKRPVVDRRYPSPGSMFDARAYPKGAWVLHMLRRQLGEDLFWKGIQRYGTDHKLKSVETADFRATMEKVSGRDLERFFYDWTERPGHPVLEIKSDYLPDSKQIQVVVKQTQQSEPFRFPLSIVSQNAESSQRERFRVEITDKEHSFYFPVKQRPAQIQIDPEQAVLAEIKETKSREWWLAQLKSADVAGRVRAAQYLGKSKTPADRETLAASFKTEKFWGVQNEIAAALGDTGGDLARDTLIAGLQQENPKVRRACADQLSKFRKDAKVGTALKDLLKKGDKSYYVESATVGSYAKLQQEDVIAVLLPWLAKPSHNEVIRTSVLDGLGHARDLAALDTLREWTKRGKPRNCRVAAVTSLSRLARTANPTDEQRKKILETVTACLENEPPAVRRAAVEALREFGQAATPSLAALEALALHDPDDRIRDQAQKAIEQIRNNAPVPVEVTRLREELERLRKIQDELKGRLDKFEKIERKE